MSLRYQIIQVSVRANTRVFRGGDFFSLGLRVASSFARLPDASNSFSAYSEYDFYLRHHFAPYLRVHGKRAGGIASFNFKNDSRIIAFGILYAAPVFANLSCFI
jgi:hypothetical protein